ncbi:hypothetical protein ACHQM5_012875 [Ranunculus cassubicifolius]
MESIIIYNNELVGDLHTNVGLTLPNLSYLDITRNKLTGGIPPSFGNLTYLEALRLGENNLTGSIPSTLGNLKNLILLEVSQNKLLGRLEALDVSHNNISGEIPTEMGKLVYLRYLNLSYNEIEGNVPTEGIFLNSSAFLVSGNSKIFLLLVTYIIRKKQSPSRQFYKDDQQVSYYDLQRVSYNDLYKATDGFSPANLVGSGSTGSVFKGSLNQDESIIAVKVLNLVQHGALKGFMAECDTLKTVRHRNLLKILTVCSSIDYRGNEFKALVFEYMPKGSLERWLHPSSDGEDVPRSLNFYERLNIAIDVASALDYLHNDCEPPIIHCDLKPSNILLDDDLTARVADFGLAKFLAKTENDSILNKKETSTIVIRGTIGYIPPEYGMHADVSIKGDMYSYGILLLEMFTGKKPTDDMFVGGLNLRQFSQTNSPLHFEDGISMWLLNERKPNLESKKSDILTSVITLGFACSVDVASERLDIKDVLKELHSLREAWDQNNV